MSHPSKNITDSASYPARNDLMREGRVPHKGRFFWGTLTRAVIIVFPAFSAIGISGIWGSAPKPPLGRAGRPFPDPSQYISYHSTNGKNNDLKFLQKPTRVREGVVGPSRRGFGAEPPLSLTHMGFASPLNLTHMGVAPEPPPGRCLVAQKNRWTLDSQ
jgi:hypothetical protein